MTTAISLSPSNRGRNYARAVILRMVDGSFNMDDARTAALSRWGSMVAEDIAKAAIGSVGTGDVDTSGAAVEFFDSIRPATIIGRLNGLRRLPFGIRMIRPGAGARGYWVGEAKPTPLSKPSLLEATTLRVLKVQALVVITVEAVRFGGTAEDLFDRDLRQAVAASWDEAFIDRNNAGVPDERPASVTYGAPSVTATGDPVADIHALIAGFSGNLAAAYFVTDPKTAAQLGLYQAGGVLSFPDLGPRGGSIIGIPVLTSEGSPRDSSGGQIALIDPTGVASADEGLRVERSEHSALQMSDDPQDGAAELISLWQCNLVAMKSTIYANWRAERPGAVSVLIDADYPATS